MPDQERNIALMLEYDGAGFYGFQRQPRQRTVQQVLEEALSRLFNRPVKISAASGRTDSGVHAAAQWMNFKIDSPLGLDRIQKGLNALLPAEVAVREIQAMPPDFHARYSAKAKTYEYRIWNHPVRSPLCRSKALHVSRPLNVSRMRRAAALLIGKHDFRSFCASDPVRKEKSTVRTIRSFSLKKEGFLLRIRVEADGFLYRMVRNLVGTLVDVGMGRLSAEEVRRILKARDRKLAGRAVPAHGLSLINVSY